MQKQKQLTTHTVSLKDLLMNALQGEKIQINTEKKLWELRISGENKN